MMPLHSDRLKMNLKGELKPMPISNKTQRATIFSVAVALLCFLIHAGLILHHTYSSCPAIPVSGSTRRRSAFWH
jgi:hypothetical protein